MEWLLNFHMDFWIHRERERERERERGIFFFLCARKHTEMDICISVFSSFFCA